MPCLSDLLVYGTGSNSKFELQVSAGCQIQAAQTIFQLPTADLSIRPYIFLRPIMSGMRATGSMLSLARVMTLNTSAQSKRFMASLPRRDRRILPEIAPRRTPLLVGAGVVGVSLWIGGLSYAMNYQRQSSSVVHGTLFTVRYDPRVQELLGDNIGYADSWAWIDGSVNHLKGQVNIKFDIKGSNGKKANVHFASRRDGGEWKTLVFNVVREDGVAINLDERELTDTGAPVMALSS